VFTSFLSSLPSCSTNLAARLIGECARRPSSVPCAHFACSTCRRCRCLVPSSIYDVPGGYRAVMFDRFSGVKGKSILEACLSNMLMLTRTRRLHQRAHISWSHGFNAPSCMTAELSPGCVHLRHGSGVTTILTAPCLAEQSLQLQARRICKWSQLLSESFQRPNGTPAKIYQSLGWTRRVIETICISFEPGSCRDVLQDKGLSILS